MLHSDCTQPDVYWSYLLTFLRFENSDWFQGKCCTVGTRNDGGDFKEVQSALELLEFSADEQLSIYKMMAAILHLGNISFAKVQVTILGGYYFRCGKLIHWSFNIITFWLYLLLSIHEYKRPYNSHIFHAIFLPQNQIHLFHPVCYNVSR